MNFSTIFLLVLIGLCFMADSFAAPASPVNPASASSNAGHSTSQLNSPSCVSPSKVSSSLYKALSNDFGAIFAAKFVNAYDSASAISRLGSNKCINEVGVRFLLTDILRVCKVDEIPTSKEALTTQVEQVINQLYPISD